MKERKPEILYSEPVNEIMGNPPARMVRYGTAAIFILFIMLLVLAWLIKYPDTIPSTIEITTTNPPVVLVSKISGRIKHLYVKDKEEVSGGQLIAVMETTASVEDIERLGRILDTIDNSSGIRLPELSHLGELQEYYAAFNKNLSDLESFENNDPFGNKIKSVNREIAGLREYIDRLSVKEKIYTENQLIEQGKFKRDSLLFIQSAISESQLELSKQSLLRNKLELQQARLEHSGKMLELSGKQQLMEEYRIAGAGESERLGSLAAESFLNLKAQMNIWKNNYFLISPVDGIATFTKFWNTNQSVLKDEPVITVVPREPGDFIGRTSLRMQRSGKVRPGLTVNIKLSGFPYLEYGMVRGVVKSKSLVPAGNAYVIEIYLPEGLTTLYGKKLDFNQNMQGTAEIITEDTRLLQRMINPFRYMISKQIR